MEGETKKKEMAGDVSASTSTTGAEKQKKKKRGIMSRIWSGLFRSHGNDFQKRLEHISREETAVLARMKRRSQNCRRIARHVIIFSVIFEAIAVGYAIMTTRSLDLNLKMRALRVLPMFLLPCLSSVTYSALVSFTRMCDHKDQKTLERLRAERQAKIDELKEKTNYYTTQQLIQRYDPDPAAKAAAASVLASKLSADSGLKMYAEDESKLNAVIGKSHDVELVQSTGLRNRKQVHKRSSGAESNLLQYSQEEMLQYSASEGPEKSKPNQLVVKHYHQTGAGAREGGWLARVAALLVGEDPTQSYALICGDCHMHNGLARKEDFPYITYYCPHCSALNRPKQLDEHVSGLSTPIMSPSAALSDISMTNNNSGSVVDGAFPSGSPVAGPVETAEENKTTVPGDSTS